jgi:uncharacterized protein
MDGEQLTSHVRQAYAAFASGDPQAYRAAFSDEIVWHVPGDNPVSGLYRGEDYFTVMPARMGPLDEWTITVESVLVNERDRAALVRFHLMGKRRGRGVDMSGCHLVRLDEAGRIVEGWGFAEDQAALDEFFRG